MVGKSDPEIALRASVGRELRRTIPHSVWKGVRRDTLDQVLGGADHAREDLFDEVRRLLVAYDAGRGEGPVPRGQWSRVPSAVPVDPRLNRSEQTRWEALRRIHERSASRHPMVVEWRRGLLGGETLSGEEAAQLLQSPAAWFLPPKRFKELRIPIARHQSTIAGMGSFEHAGKASFRILPLAISWEDARGKRRQITESIRYVHYPGGTQLPLERFD